MSTLPATTGLFSLKRPFLSERFILLLIVVNAIILFLQGFAFPDGTMLRLERIDHFLTLMFLVEALVKIGHYKPGTYFRDGWNQFDFALVLLALPSLVIFLVGADLLDLHFLLIFRILRVFKFFRVLKFIPNIDHLVTGVGRALRSSVVIVLAFFIFNFIIALLSFSFYREIAPEYFANPLLSFYSTFKIFTVEGWYEIPDLIAERTSDMVGFFTRTYFILLLFGGGVFGLSLINSIFVDNMLSDNTEKMEEQVQRLEEKIDELIRRNGSGGGA
jgi:voltage-gated sodium channel